MIPQLTAAGHLPVGRYPCEPLAVQQRFVDHQEFAGSTTRAGRWKDWCDVTQALRATVPVCAAWLGGSYISGKVDPDDVDSVYLIRDSDIAAVADPIGKQVLGLVANNMLKAAGYEVDSFVVHWRPNPTRAPRDNLDVKYLASRGYWDDFWQRLRAGAKTAPPVMADALPRRGYLEVTLDGFSV